MKKTWKHLNFEQRKTIASGIAKPLKLYEIAELIGVDPTSVSKEVKKNRIPYKNFDFKDCSRLNRWPFVCTGCPLWHNKCSYKKYRYEPRAAQRNADANLKITRKGIDLSREEFDKLNNAVYEGCQNHKSIYQIKIENNIEQSVSTIYRYIKNDYLSTKRYQLPEAVHRKKRKHNKKYDYSTSNSKIDRSNHTFIDYLSFVKSHPWSNIWQLDFLGNKKSDNNSILTLIMPDLQFPLLSLIEKPNAKKVVEYFDQLEEKLGTETFSKIFDAILTDRDPCFSDIEGIMFSKITGEKRLELFFCDPYVSSQKPNVENLNRQLRKFFPKDKSADTYSADDLLNAYEVITSTPKKSLDSFTPKEAFIKVFGEESFYKIM